MVGQNGACQRFNCVGTVSQGTGHVESAQDVVLLQCRNERFHHDEIQATNVEIKIRQVLIVCYKPVAVILQPRRNHDHGCGGGCRGDEVKGHGFVVYQSIQSISLL